MLLGELEDQANDRGLERTTDAYRSLDRRESEDPAWQIFNLTAFRGGPDDVIVRQDVGTLMRVHPSVMVLARSQVPHRVLDCGFASGVRCQVAGGIEWPH